MIDKLTIDEKIRLLSGVGWWRTYEIDSVGLPALFMCDGPHGLRIQDKQGDHLGINQSEKAVCYPTESTVACSFDKNLLFELGKTLGKEALKAKSDMVLGPGVNIKRTPLCGRNFEYYSEDPVLSGELGAAFVSGMQSVGISTCVKHYACNNIEYRRNFSDSRVDERTLREIYLKVFEIIVKKARPRAIMCAYNLVNGTYCAENKYLLTDILRGEWGYDGIVVSDWGAVSNPTASVKAGLNLEMPFANGCEHIKKAYENGEVSETEINIAVEKIIAFINESVNNRKNRELYSFDREAALLLTRRAAAESQVLLKNKKNVFPIKQGEKILIVGEVAEKPHYQGGGSSHINDEGAISLLQALSQANVICDYQQGFDLEQNKVLSVDVAGYDKVIFAVGLRETDESEGYDRKDMRLPECVDEILENNLSLCKKSGVLLFTGGVVELPWIEQADGVMYCGLPGENGSFGVVDVLTGKVCPSGKLTETWVSSEKDLYTYTKAKSNGKTVEYNEGVFVGYRYYEAKDIKPLFAFGHGLSYTKFAYSDFSITDTENGFEITFKIKNQGDCVGKETTMIFVRHPITKEIRPVKTLLDFSKTELKPNEEKTISFIVSKEQLTVYNVNGEKYLAGGEYIFDICSSSDCIQGSVKALVKVKGEKVTEFTIISEIWADDEKRRIFQETILNRILAVFGLQELPESLHRIIMEVSLKNLCGLAPSVITGEVLEQFLSQINQLE